MEVVVFPRIDGVQWSNTVGSTLWGMASGVAVVLDIVLGLAEIAPASRQPLQVAGRRFVGPVGQGPAYSSGGILRAPQVKVLRAPAVAGHAAVPDPLDGVPACTLGGPGDTWRSRTPRGGSGTPDPSRGDPGPRLRVMGIPFRGARGDTGPPPK